ncbi:MAG: hypothetical protein AAFN00_21170, partial [Cyanobacteria bacterium J06558_2]
LPILTIIKKCCISEKIAVYLEAIWQPAALFYNRQNWQLRLNLNNLFDVDFIESADTSSARNIYVGRPFVVRGSIAVQL